MANKKAREARRKKRERIRRGPSDTAQAWLTLMGIEITKWPAPRFPSRGVDGKIDMTDLENAVGKFKAWHGVVKDTPHITKMLYCTCDEQWIREAKLLRSKAEAWKHQHPGQMVFPHGLYRSQNWTMDFETQSVGRVSKVTRKSYERLNGGGLMLSRTWQDEATKIDNTDFSQIEARIAAHLTKEKS